MILFLDIGLGFKCLDVGFEEVVLSKDINS